MDSRSFSLSLQHGTTSSSPPWKGSEVSLEKQTQTKVSPDKLDHFLTFIKSPTIVRDLPFSEKRLKLSFGFEIKIPNVIRISIPEQIVKQYQSYCAETPFLSHSTLCRILKVCSGSTRKSLQGLDYLSGTKTVFMFWQSSTMSFTS
jgi:hypothetical protein